jgi:membrane protease YdiL (CAAX protease family)
VPPQENPESRVPEPSWISLCLPWSPAVVVRSLVRLVVFVVLTFLLWWILGAVLAPVTDVLIASVLSLSVAVLTTTALMMRIYEMRPFYHVGLFANGLAAAHLVRGLLMGTLSSLGIIAVQGLAGWVQFEPVPVEGSRMAAAAFGFILLLVGATGEELLFRGYGFQQLLCGFGPWLTIGATSGLFAWAHTANPAASPAGMINTALFGLVFGYAYWRTQDLWLPLGMHFSWNFSLAAIGANVSGLKIKLLGVSVVPTGPPLWTGGDYGPEGSALTSVTLVVLFLLLWRLPLGRQEQGLLVALREGGLQ